MSKHSLSLFDRVSLLLKRLTLDTDLNDKEGAALARVTDKVNDVRERYVDRKIEELPCDSSGV